MNEYKIIILRERPELAPIAAEWFHCKWGVPTEAYLECIADKFEIASAATSTEEIWGGKGNPIYPPAQEVLRAHGIGKTAYTDFSGKRARQVTQQDYEYYDYLLCADTANVMNTMRITGPDYQDKIHLLLDYAGRYGQSIADPWYTGRFDETYRDVCQGCEGFLDYLRQGNRL